MKIEDYRLVLSKKIGSSYVTKFMGKGYNDRMIQLFETAYNHLSRMPGSYWAIARVEVDTAKFMDKLVSCICGDIHSVLYPYPQ